MRDFNPYDVDPESVPLSRKITDEGELLKYRLSAAINKVIKNMTTEEIVELTELHPSDISRIKVQSVKRFTLDRLIKILILLGRTVTIQVKTKKAAS